MANHDSPGAPALASPARVRELTALPWHVCLQPRRAVELNFEPLNTYSREWVLLYQAVRCAVLWAQLCIQLGNGSQPTQCLRWKGYLAGRPVSVRSTPQA